MKTIVSGLDSGFFIIEWEDFYKSVKPSAQREGRYRRPFKPAKSTVFRILTQTNMNSKSTINRIKYTISFWIPLPHCLRMLCPQYFVFVESCDLRRCDTILISEYRYQNVSKPEGSARVCHICDIL